jgi:hypothetical protein
VPTPDKQVTLPIIEIFGRGGSLKSSWYGDCLPSATSRCSSTSTAGPLRPRRLRHRAIGIGDVEAAFDKMHAARCCARSSSWDEGRQVARMAGCRSHPSPGGVRVERVVTSGVFELDGGSWEVDNNVWVVGDDTECLVIDAAHDARAILEAVGDRTLVGIVCTHGHNDHVNAVP